MPHPSDTLLALVRRINSSVGGHALDEDLANLQNRIAVGSLDDLIGPDGVTDWLAAGAALLE